MAKRTRNFHRISVREVQLTGRVGALDESVTVDQLKAVFGEPDGPSPDGKATYEWRVRFDDQKVATVYDYKGSRWSVGGHEIAVVERVRALLAEEAEAVAAEGQAEVEAKDAFDLLAERDARIERLERQVRILGGTPIE